MYSVFNYDTRSYDYYEGPGPGGTHAGSPDVPRRKGMGATPEQAAWRVPASATKVGSGVLPKGKIAALGAVDAPDGFELRTLALPIAAAVVLWRMFR